MINRRLDALEHPAEEEEVAEEDAEE